MLAATAKPKNKAMETTRVYTYDEAVAASTKFFGGDDLAADAFVRKYALKTGPNEILEPTPAQMFDRLAKALAAADPVESRVQWEKVYREQLEGFRRIVLQGSPMAALGNQHQRMTLSNCYVVPVKGDSLQHLFNALYEMAQIQAFRGGVGIDVSPLRPQGAKVNNAALRSTGAWAWCDLFSYVTRIVGQSGRQGALMLTMDVSHPDIEHFVKMKADKTKVTGANVSVKLTDEFMRAVVDDTDFTLRYEFENGMYEPLERTVKAKDLWNLIVEQATKNAEPGLLMWDTIIRRSPADAYAAQGFKTICTNPCSEIPLSAYDSCRLTSLNLTGFVTDSFMPNAKFNFDAFRESIHVAVRMLDNIVDIDHDLQPFEEQRQSNRNGRRLGLGTHGLGDTLARLCKRYDQEETIDFVDKLYCFMKVEAYKASVQLAKERGPFPIWNWDLEKDNEFIKELPDELKDEMAKYGRRNIAILTCAPTGTVSLMSQTSSGIEPIFRLSYTRKVKVNQAELFDASEVETDKTGDRWRRFKINHPAYGEFIKNFPGLNVDYWVTSDQIDYRQRVKMQAAITRHLDHASSSTINLPKGTPQSVVGDIYIMAWQLGLKGVTVYVDGSRGGILITDEKAVNASDERPTEVDAVAHTIGTNGHSYTVFVGFVNNKAYEVFCVPGRIAAVSDGLSGKIIKAKSKRYDFVSGKDDDGDWALTVSKINKNEDNEASAFTRLVSTALRHGIPIQTINEQLDKSKGTVVSLAKAMNRVLAKYVGTVTGRECPACNSTNTVFEEGCMKCHDCAHSKCG